jgi:hypothetical protein
MRTATLTFLVGLVFTQAAFAQDASALRVDGSGPGKILLVLRDLPPDKPALIVREPPYLNVPQRSILFFSPQGTPAQLALALIAFDRIRAQDGEVITRPRTDDNIGRTPEETGYTRSTGDPVKDSVNKVYRDQYLRGIQSILELVKAQPEKEVRGLGKVRWVQVDRPPLPTRP